MKGVKFQMNRDKKSIRSLYLTLLCCLLEALAGLFALYALDGSGGWCLCCVPLLQTATALCMFTDRAKKKQIEECSKPAAQKVYDIKKRERSVTRSSEKTASKSDEPLPLFTAPTLGSCLYAGALTASSILLSAPFRLLSDKLLANASYRSLIPLSYMSGPVMTVFVLLLLCPILSELFHRHLLQPRVFSLLGKWSLPAMGLFYALSFPLLNRVAVCFFYGVALARICDRTHSKLLCYVCSLVMNLLSLAYQYMLVGGLSDGSAMGYREIAGLGLIFWAVALSTLGIAESFLKKRKPKLPEACVWILVFVLLMVLGIALVAR